VFIQVANPRSVPQLSLHLV